MSSVTDYKTATTYGAPSTPSRPTLTQNNNGTVRIDWSIPNPLNDVTGTSVQYDIQILKKGSTWGALKTLNSTDASPFDVIDMSVLKTAANYNDTENGNQIKVKITATNSYGASTASEENLPSAIYQGVPNDYTGAYTLANQNTTQVTITWDPVSTDVAKGYSPLTGWAVGY